MVVDWKRSRCYQRKGPPYSPRICSTRLGSSFLGLVSRPYRTEVEEQYEPRWASCPRRSPFLLYRQLRSEEFIRARATYEVANTSTAVGIASIAHFDPSKSVSPFCVLITRFDAMLYRLVGESVRFLAQNANLPFFWGSWS